MDDRNAVAILSADADKWTGVDDSTGQGVTREDVGRYLRYLTEIRYIGKPAGRGRQVPDIKAEVLQGVAIGGVGGRGGVR